MNWASLLLSFSEGWGSRPGRIHIILQDLDSNIFYVKILKKTFSSKVTKGCFRQYRIMFIFLLACHDIFTLSLLGFVNINA